MQLGVPGANLRLDVEIDERPEQVNDQHQRQPESGDRCGVVAIHMVGVPVSDHLVEGLVLYQPPGVSQPDDIFG